MIKVQHGQDLNHLALDPVHVLIIDYDVTRFHSFDLFSWCLLDKTLFYDIIPELTEIRNYTTMPRADLVNYYRLNCIDFNPLNHFVKYRSVVNEFGYAFLQETYDRMYASPYVRCTETDLAIRMGTVFNRKQISGAIVKSANDSHEPLFMDTCKLTSIKVPSIFDIHMMCDVIESGGYTALICGSVDLVLQLLLELVQRRGYHGLNTVMICKYGYNYEWHVMGEKPMRMLRYTPELAQFEVKYNINFGLIDPYTGLTHRSAMLNKQKE